MYQKQDNLSLGIYTLFQVDLILSLTLVKLISTQEEVRIKSKRNLSNSIHSHILV